MKNLRVLIVDDSVVFRSQIKLALEAVPGLDVVGTASNGKIALDKLDMTPTDVITLDLEMPELDGLAMLRELKRRGSKAQVIVFSSKTARGADITLEALHSGAVDFVTKPGGPEAPSGSYGSAHEAIRETLVSKIMALANHSHQLDQGHVRSATTVGVPTPAVDVELLYPRALVIGSSTGGPAALEKILSKVGVAPAFPIFIVQHMPPVFTTSFARRIGELSGIPCSEGVHGERIQSGRIYLAPGDFHMRISGGLHTPRLQLAQDHQENGVRPAVDPLFESAAQVYGAQTLAWVLTGMGSDGRRGAQAVKAAGGAVAIQRRDTCVVYGMPGAVEESGAYDVTADLLELRRMLDSAIARTAHIRRAG